MTTVISQLMTKIYLIRLHLALRKSATIHITCCWIQMLCYIRLEKKSQYSSLFAIKSFKIQYHVLRYAWDCSIFVYLHPLRKMISLTSRKWDVSLTNWQNWIYKLVRSVFQGCQETGLVLFFKRVQKTMRLLFTSVDGG